MSHQDEPRRQLAGPDISSNSTDAFREQLAQLWQKILLTDPVELFGRHVELLERRPGFGDELAQPGFVGRKYRPGGVLFFGRNPGKGGKSPGQGDQLQFAALRALRDCDDRELLGRFEQITTLLEQRVMPA